MLLTTQPLSRAIACATVILLTSTATPQACAAVPAPEFGAIAAQTFAQTKMPGMSVAIVRDGRIVFEKGYGSADAAKATAVTAQTPFAVGSISKQFTAACVLLLAARGKLNLDDPISKFVPSVPNGTTITLRQALWQVTGLHEYPNTNEHDWPLTGSIDPQKILAILATDKSDFPPGTQWAYSNANYAVLARAVEVASGMPYGRFLEENIFEPLGMKRSGYGFAAQSSMPVASVCTSTFSACPATLSLDVYYGAGGVVSSAHDMGLWLNGLLAKRVLDPAELTQLWSAGHLASGAPVNYAMGFEPATIDGHREVWHNGLAPFAGGYCYDAIFPDDGIGIVVLTNAGESAARGVPEKLTRELFEAIIPPASHDAENAAITALIKTYWSQMAAAKVDLTALTPAFAAKFTPEFQTQLAAGVTAFGTPEWTYLGSHPDENQLTRYEYRLTFSSGEATFLIWLDTAGKIAGSRLKM